MLSLCTNYKLEFGPFFILQTKTFIVNISLSILPALSVHLVLPSSKIKKRGILTVWPDVGIKNSPNLYKHIQKVAMRVVFNLKSMSFKIAQKVTKYYGHFWRTKCKKELSKIVLSCHTESPPFCNREQKMICSAFMATFSLDISLWTNKRSSSLSLSLSSALAAATTTTTTERYINIMENLNGKTSI